MNRQLLRDIIIWPLLLVSVCIIIIVLRNQRHMNTEIDPKNDNIVLSVLAGQSTTDAGLEDIFNDALSKKFPNVELEWECVDWGELFNLQMQARFAAGDIPDLIIGKAQDVYTYYSLGNLAPIPDDCIGKIDGRAMQAVTFDGVAYGLPYNTFYQGVVYNKDIFERFNLDVPTTQEELEKIVETLNNNHVTPFASHFLESWQVANMTMQFLANGVFNEKTDWGNDFRKEKENFTGNSQVRNCLLQNQFILNNSWPDALDIDQYECNRRFNEGEAAMYLTGSWWLQSVSGENSSNSYGIFPYPNQNGDSKLIRETNITFMKSNESKNNDLVDKILRELVSNEQLVKDMLDFTQTHSVIHNVSLDYQFCIDQDISRYEESNQVIEITSDNNQIIWEYQNKLAMKQLEWLKGDASLDDVLEYADHTRQESGN